MRHDARQTRPKPGRMEVRADSIPGELKELSQWVVWDWTWNADREKWDKPPRQTSGSFASVSKQSTWCDFDSALEAHREDFDGIGVVLTGSDPFFGIDLDHVWDLETGEVLFDGAHELVFELGTYGEVSPSGTGIRAFGRGNLPAGARRRGSIEVYDSLRYLTVTGNQLEGTPDSIRQFSDSEMAALHSLLFPESQTPSIAKESKADERSGGKYLLSDDDLLNKARKARNGSAFAALFDDGKVTSSLSEATAALLCHLAFWTDRDAARMDRLFRRSALMRPKWESPRGDSTWGEREIQTAIQSVPRGYSAGGVNATVRRLDSSAGENLSDVPVRQLGSRSKPIRLYSAHEIKYRPRPEWLVSSILLKQSFAVLVAPPGVGKSFLALDWACSIAAGIDWLGHPIAAGPVVYLAAEGMSGLGLRVNVWEETHQYPDLDNIHFIDVPVEFRDGDHTADLISTLRQLPEPPVLLVVDTMARCMGAGDENSSRDVGQFIAGLDLVRTEIGCAILVIHHSSKSNPANPRGSSALEGACDTMLFLRGDPDKLSLDCHKQKDSDPFPTKRLRLERAFNSCIVVDLDGLPSATENQNVRRLVLAFHDHFGEGQATGTALKAVCELRQSTYYRALNVALESRLVQKVGDSSRSPYQLTAAGLESIAHLPGHSQPKNTR